MEIKLNYFDIEGFGEPIRLILNFAKVKWIDNRVQSTEWPELKKTMSFEELPALQIDDKIICECKAIVRYLGHKFDMIPKDSQKALKIDEIIETQYDIINSLDPLFHTTNYGHDLRTEEEKNASFENIIKRVNDGRFQEKLLRMDSMLSNTGYLDGGNITVADIFVYGMLRLLKFGTFPGLKKELLLPYKNIQHLMEKMESLPEVRAYYKMKPVRQTYFNIEGKAEPIRLTLKLANVDFEDRRIDVEDWQHLKHFMPNNKMPELLINGRNMTHNTAIMRYLGTKYGLVPSEHSKAYIIDNVIELTNDMKNTTAPSVYMDMVPGSFGWENCTDDEKSKTVKKMRDNVANNSLPFMLSNLNKLLPETGFIAGGSVTIGDIYAYSAIRYLKHIGLEHISKDIVDKYENLMALCEKIEAFPAVKEHYIQQEESERKTSENDPALYDDRQTSIVPTPQKMQYVSLGSSGIQVSRLSYGNWVNSRGGQSDLCDACVKKCYDHGVNFFDTAEMYSNGDGERQLGHAIKKLNVPRDGQVISTKLFWGYRPNNEELGKCNLVGVGELEGQVKVNSCGTSRKHLIEAMDRSLNLLQMDYVDIMFLHRYDHTSPVKETLMAIKEQLDSGKILYWGTSEWTGVRIMEAMHMADVLEMPRPVAEQCQYNMLVRHKMEREYSILFDEYGMGTTIWSPLASGILTGKYNNGIPDKSRFAENPDLRGSYNKYFSEDKKSETVKKLNDIDAIAKELGMTMTQLALAWTLAYDNVSTCILGATKVEQLEENFKALENVSKVTPEICQRLNRILNTSPEIEFNNRKMVPKPNRR